MKIKTPFTHHIHQESQSSCHLKKKSNPFYLNKYGSVYILTCHVSYRFVNLETGIRTSGFNYSNVA